MDNNHPEVASVLIGGKQRNIKLGPAAFRLARMKHGIHITNEELTAPNLDTLALMAYVGCLPDDRDLEEEEFMVLMANSNEGEILAAVGKSLARMTEGLSALDVSGAKSTGKGRGKK